MNTVPESTRLPIAPQAPRLLDRLRLALQDRGYGLDAANRFGEWCRQFIVFHHLRHPHWQADTLSENK